MTDVAEEKPLIAVERLIKSFDDVQILKGLSLSILEGELFSIIGPSGCGKSTFLRCLNGLEIFDTGKIEIAGFHIERRQAGDPDAHLMQKFHQLRQHVGMVFQSFNLFPHKTILENVMLAPMKVKSVPREEARAIAERLLEKVGLSALKERYPSAMSGGQQQRAAIARALAMQPKVMLYDEPTSALDPEMVDEVLHVMRELDGEGMTQMVVTHEMRFARDASDYVIYMEKGEIVEISDEDEIFSNPKDERTRRFLRKFL
jgi:polar amino acid transport system ATP-binding protein